MKQPKIRLLEDRVLVIPHEEIKKTPSGILLPGGPVKEYPIMATVIAVGPELDERLSPGDVIYYRFGEGLEIELDGDNYIVIRESGILVVNEPKAIDAFRAVELLRELADEAVNKPKRQLTPYLRAVIKLIYPNEAP